MSAVFSHPVCDHLYTEQALSSANLSNTAPSRMLGRQKVLANEYLLKWIESAM